MVVRASQEGKDSVEISVVVPVYNEAPSIEEIYSELRDALNTLDSCWEIVFVDDGSTDDSGKLLSVLGEKDSRVRIASFASNRGLSAALTEGFHLSRGKTIVSIDGDLQFDPREMLALLQALETTDVVCGRRKPRRDEWHRRVLSFLAYLARYSVLGDRIHDSGCTFRAYRRSSVEDLVLQPGHHRFIPYILRMNGYDVSEIPVSHRVRRHGRSKYGLSRVVKGLATLISLRLSSLKSLGQ